MRFRVPDGQSSASGPSIRKYFRFNVDQELQDIEIEEWKKMEMMDVMVTNYLSQQETAEQLETCVRGLVNEVPSPSIR